MDTASSRRVLFILLGLSLVALATTGSIIYSRMSYLWGILLITNWVWARISLRGVYVTRTARLRRAHIGQIFEERFEIANPGKMPRLWIEVRDLARLPGSRGSHVVTLIGGRQRRSYLARSRLMQRGSFPLGPTEVHSGDPFGLFPTIRTLPVTENLLVYPLMLDVQSFPNPPGMLTGGEALQRRTHHVTPNAAGVREYMPGDGLNRIHWPTTVRRDKLMVKEFELDPQADIWIFVDGEAGVHAAQPFSVEEISRNVFLNRQQDDLQLPPASEEYMACVAASLARFYLRRRRAVALSISSQNAVLLPPDRGGRQLGKILEALALLRADGALELSATLEAQARNITRGSTVVIVTPSGRGQLSLTFDSLMRRGLRPVIVLIHAESFGGAPGTEGLAKTLKVMHLPVRIVRLEVDIKQALITDALNR